jgi:6,7-dimethyl-8-ribityllumazine synthase
MAASGRFHAVICLGAIIKGETPHYDYIASAVVGALGEIMQRHDVPVVLGVLTTDNVDQAIARAGVEQDNKGYEAAVTAIEMASLHRILHGQSQ